MRRGTGEEREFPWGGNEGVGGEEGHVSEGGLAERGEGGERVQVPELEDIVCVE